jgi:hypothetical protein
MVLFVLSFIGTSALATAHDVLLAECIHMQGEILLLENPAAKLTLNLCFFTRHLVGSHPASFNRSLAKLTVDRHKGTLRLMEENFGLRESYKASFYFTRALDEIIVAGLFVLKDSLISEDLTAATCVKLAPEGKF